MDLRLLCKEEECSHFSNTFWLILVEEFVVTAVEAGSLGVCSTKVDWVYTLTFYTKLSLNISDVRCRTS